VSDDNFLSRWSRRKHAAKREPAPLAPADPPAAGALAAQTGIPPTASEAAAAPAEAQPLPPLDSLTPESDFSAFMQSSVDPDTRRTALKTLFSNERFNVQDGLDVYIDDYSKADPLPAGWLEKMNQFAALDAHKVLDPRPEPPDEGAVRVAQAPQKAEGEQPLEGSAEDAPSDTPDNGSKPARLGESGPEGQA
jgi:hypothetical protein